MGILPPEPAPHHLPEPAPHRSFHHAPRQPVRSRPLLRLPAIESLLIQAAVLLLLALALPAAKRHAALVLSPLEAAFLQGWLAALASRWRGQAAWWSWIHFLFAPALLGALMLQLPPALFLAAFLLFLLLYWSTFRTQVPLYLSGAAARNAVADALPRHPLRFIDIGSGLGGMVLDLAERRPESHFEGIELAPLPWLLSRLRLAANRHCRGHGRCRLLRGDYDRLDFSHYDVVFAYLSPAAMPRLWHKARAEMRPGTLLLSHEFAIPDAAPDIATPTRPGGTVLYGWRM